MNFDFSDDQKAMKSEVRRFLAAHCPPARVRAVLDHPECGYDAELWQAIAAQGWLGVSFDEEHGGLGLGHIELCAIAEELGRVLAPLPFASTLYFLAEALLIAGDDRQRALYLPQIATGALIGCCASAEGPGVANTLAPGVEVRGGKLFGVKTPVTDGGIAHMALTLASENGKPTLFLVRLDQDGVTRKRLQSLDPSRDLCEINFDGAAAERLGLMGEGAEVLEQIENRAAILLAFEQCGGADRCLEMARDYALQRYAFGRQIGSYQAIKHKLAEMYVRNEIARSNAYYGAWALNADALELPAAASAARIAASDAFWFAAKENIQTHGGIGFTWEMDCHIFYRRSRQLALVAGAPRIWKERLVAQLERRNQAA